MTYLDFTAFRQAAKEALRLTTVPLEEDGGAEEENRTIKPVRVKDSLIVLHRFQRIRHLPAQIRLMLV